MALTELKTSYHFGLTAAVSGSLIFINDHVIAYPSGAGVVLHNSDSNTQQMCPTVSKSRGVTAMAYFEPGKILAAAEKSDGDKPFISFFELDLSQLKRKKALQSVIIQSDRFESLSFSADGKYLAAIGGPPDHLLAIWMWESKSQAFGKIKLSSFSAGLPPPIQGVVPKINFSVNFNPFDSQRFVIYGRETLRQYAIHISNVIPYKHSRNEGSITAWVVCLAWVSEDTLLVGLDSNIVQLYEGGEWKQEFRILYSSETDFLLGGSEDPDEYSIRCICVYEKGFICSCGRGKVHMFERSDEANERYKKLREIELVQKTTKRDLGGFGLVPFITAISLNPSQKVFVCLTDSGFVYAYDILKDYRKDVKPQLYLMTSKVHCKEITDVDVCVRKPLIVTCSLDKTILLWNYATCRLELYKEFVEPVYSVSLHPDGLYLVAGFEKSLKLMNIFVNEMHLLKTFPVSNCRSCRFANGGHFFAVANWNIIEIYSSITLQILYHLRSHVDRVNAIFWSKNDIRLVSVSEDGETFEWDVLASRKVSENVLRHCRYYDVCVEGKSIFVVGSDFVVKEIQDSSVTKKISASGVQITRLAITNAGRCMFLGLWSGALRSLQYPLAEPDEYLEFQGHFAPITGLSVTPDDNFLVSVSEDSVVIVWIIVDSKVIAQSKLETMFSKEVLANPTDLEEKNTLLNQLEVRVEQLKMENQLQLHNRDVKYNDKLMKVTNKLRQELESVKLKNYELEAENVEVQEKYSTHLTETIKKLRHECLVIEQRSLDKLKVETEKYQSLKEQGTQSQEQFEQELEEKNKRLSSLQNTLVLTLAAIRSDPLPPPPNPMLAWERDIADLEDDTDMELLNRKESFKDLFAKENQAIEELNVDIIVLKRQATVLNNMTKTQKKMITARQQDMNMLQADTHVTEQNIVQLRKLLQERSEALDNRLKMEADLKEKNQNLEKAKFVLDVKMQALQKQLEPMNSEIKYLKLQIFGKEGEFNEHRKFISLNRAIIFRGKEKLQTIQEQEYDEKIKVVEAKKKWNRLATDLQTCAPSLNKPRQLKKRIFSIYKNNLNQLDAVESNVIDRGQLCGMNPQRDHLESLIANLKSQMTRNQLKYDNDDKIMMKQNILLMREINELKRELKENQGVIALMTEALELDKLNPKMSTRDFLDVVVSKTSNAKLFRRVEEMKVTIDERMKTIKQLQHDNLQLKVVDDSFASIFQSEEKKFLDEVTELKDLTLNKGWSNMMPKRSKSSLKSSGNKDETSGQMEKKQELAPLIGKQIIHEHSQKFDADNSAKLKETESRIGISMESRKQSTLKSQSSSSKISEVSKIKGSTSSLPVPTTITTHDVNRVSTLEFFQKEAASPDTEVVDRSEKENLLKLPKISPQTSQLRVSHESETH